MSTTVVTGGEGVGGGVVVAVVGTASMHVRSVLELGTNSASMRATLPGPHSVWGLHWPISPRRNVPRGQPAHSLSMAALGGRISCVPSAHTDHSWQMLLPRCVKVPGPHETQRASCVGRHVVVVCPGPHVDATRHGVHWAWLIPEANVTPAVHEAQILSVDLVECTRTKVPGESTPASQQIHYIRSTPASQQIHYIRSSLVSSK